MRESIRFAWGSSSVGDFVVAMSKNGIVAVEFSSMHSATEEALSIRFPDAEFRLSRDELADVTGLLARLIDDPTIHCELPIDLRGTPFGVRIWLMMRKHPPVGRPPIARWRESSAWSLYQRTPPCLRPQARAAEAVRVLPVLIFATTEARCFEFGIASASDTKI